MKLISIESGAVHTGLGHYDWKIVVERGLWRKRRETYFGDGTVWHRFPDGKRPGTWAESTLCGFQEAERMRRYMERAAKA